MSQEDLCDIFNFEDEIFDTNTRDTSIKHVALFKPRIYYPGNENNDEKCLENLRDHPKLFKYHADYLCFTNKIQEAIKCYQELLLLFKDNAVVTRSIQESIAWCHLKLQEKAEAQSIAVELQTGSLTFEHHMSSRYLLNFVPMEGLPNTIKVEPLDEEIDIIHEPIGIEESEQQPMKTEIQTKAVEEMLVPTSESQNNSIDPIAVSPPSHTSNKHKRKSCKAQPLIEKLTQNLSKFELDYKKHMMEHAEDCCMEYNGPHVYRYFCPFCFHMFPDSNPFLIHMGFKSTMSSRFLAVHRISVRCDCMVMCHFCSTIYDSILTYQNHVENTMGDSSHDFGRHVCLVCNSKFKSLCGLNRHHKQIHKPVFQHHCTLCDTHFPNNLSLEVHRTLCHRDMYYCVTCDNYFMTPMNSKEHERENTSHVIKKYFVCTVELFRDVSKTNPILNNESGNGKTQPDGTNAKFDHKSLSETVNILPDSLQNSSKHDPKNGSISSTVKMLPDDLKNNPKYGHESVKMLQKDSENITIVTLPPDLQNNPRFNQESATNSSPVKMLSLQNNPQFDHENVTIIQMPDLQNNQRLDLEAITEGSTISSVTQTRSTPIIFNDLQKTITTYENIMNQPVQKYSDELLSHMFEDLFVKFESLNRCETNKTSYYVCPYCCMIFNTKVGFLFHVGVVLGDQKSKSFTNAHLVPLNISQLKCVYCQVVTSPDLETYHSHLNIKHLQEPKYQCGPECNAKFSFICELNKHKMSCVKCAQFIRCHNCKAAFKNILGFWSHERMCKKLNAFCVDCKVQFQTLIKFESHQCKKQEDNCVLLPIETQTTNSGLKITDFVKCNKCMSAAVCPLLQKLNSTFVAKSKS
ncbi:hypothetical protein B566_EDAN011549 [Ephemera danica]|nr:hypothetical protein B566_EDAN011549 [Ephemera danica]